MQIDQPDKETIIRQRPNFSDYDKTVFDNLPLGPKGSYSFVCQSCGEEVSTIILAGEEYVCRSCCDDREQRLTGKKKGKP